MNRGTHALLVLCGVVFPTMHLNAQKNPPSCLAAGQQYRKSLDEHTTLGRVAWSNHLESCIAETTNVAHGTEMYSVVAIPSKKTISYDGGLIAADHRSSREKAAQHQRLFEEAINGK
jgi:hypothetical protein